MPDVKATEYLSIAEAAEKFGIHPETLRGWVRKGAIAHVRLGPAPGVIRLRERDIAKPAPAPSDRKRG